MSQSTLLAPLFVQVLLTFALGIWLGLTRLRAVQSGEATIKGTALGQPAWPTRVLQIANSFGNQFEMPVLFYVLIALLLITGKGDGLMVALAWAFVGFRIVHAFVHTTTNTVSHRFTAFLIGTGVLATMWIVFGVRVLSTGG